MSKCLILMFKYLLSYSLIFDTIKIWHNQNQKLFYLFPIAAITSQCNVFKHPQICLTVLKVRNLMGLNGLSQCVGCPYFLYNDPFLLQSQQSHYSGLCVHDHFSNYDSFASFIYWAQVVIQTISSSQNQLISNINSTCNLNILPCKITNSQVVGIRTSLVVVGEVVVMMVVVVVTKLLSCLTQLLNIITSNASLGRFMEQFH